MTTIFSTIMLAALSSGARLCFGVFVVILLFLCIYIPYALIKWIKKTKEVLPPGYASDTLHLTNVLGGLANGNSHNSSGSNS